MHKKTDKSLKRGIPDVKVGTPKAIENFLYEPISNDVPIIHKKTDKSLKRGIPDVKVVL